MEIKSIQDIKNLNVVGVEFSVNKLSKNNKNEYIVDVEIQTSDLKKIKFTNTSIRGIRFANYYMYDELLQANRITEITI